MKKDMVCSLTSEWCVVTSFYQRSANPVSFYLFKLRNLFYLISDSIWNWVLQFAFNGSGTASAYFLLFATAKDTATVVPTMGCCPCPARVFTDFIGSKCCLFFLFSGNYRTNYVQIISVVSEDFYDFSATVNKMGTERLKHVAMGSDHVGLMTVILNGSVQLQTVRENATCQGFTR